MGEGWCGRVALVALCVLITLAAGCGGLADAKPARGGSFGPDVSLRQAERAVIAGTPAVAARHLQRARVALRGGSATSVRLARLGRVGHLYQRLLVSRLERDTHAAMRAHMRAMFKRETAARRADMAHANSAHILKVMRVQAARSLRGWRERATAAHMRPFMRGVIRNERACIVRITQRQRAVAAREARARTDRTPSPRNDPNPPRDTPPSPPPTPTPERPSHGIDLPPSDPDRETTRSEGPVRALNGVRYDPHGGLLLDALVPADPLAAVVLVHGGAWRGGQRADMALIAADLAALGYATFTVDYRKGGASLFPAQYEDVAAAVRWVRVQAGDLNLVGRPVVLLGASAGGHIALMAAFDRHAQVDAVIGWSAPVDLVHLATDRSPRPGCSSPQMCATPAWFADQIPAIMGCPLDARQTLLGLGIPTPCPQYYRANSPRLLDHPRLLPTLLIHTPADPLVAIGPARDMVDQLRRRGGIAVLVDHPGEGHANQLHALAMVDTVEFLTANGPR